MSIFEYDDIKKTRRSIIIVASMMIAASIYVGSSQDISIFGLELTIGRESIVTSLSFLLVYLWIMLVVHAIREFAPEHFESRRKALEISEKSAHDSLYPPADEEEDHGQWDDHKEIQAFYRPKKAIIEDLSSFTNITVKVVGEILPPLLISLYVMFKFDVLHRVFISIWEALRNL